MDSISAFTASFLTPDDHRVAASILFNAYQDDPLFKQILADENPEQYKQKLRAAIREELQSLWQQKQVLIGIFQEHKLVALTAIADEYYCLGDDRQWHWRLKMMIGAGWYSTKELMAKEQLLKDRLKDVDYSLLHFIAVDPHYQGRGIGEQLLKTADHWRRKYAAGQALAVFVPEGGPLSLFLNNGFHSEGQFVIDAVAGELLLSEI
ncbi:GNAT family N-acetyltransferase [Paraferrimonas sp. SM1919]|uniref:GNAT family N-acetyltransferase n=1 Tax=Paraferrimonas sp. SM1919 TaxID=2662263 RepID=UPI0013D3C9A3|nr:GNAT family N-acetyltransferase [Paraferrimonas sp. SM1919]